MGKQLRSFVRILAAGVSASLVVGLVQAVQQAPARAAAPGCDEISYGYDAAGRLAGVRDAAGATARYHGPSSEQAVS